MVMGTFAFLLGWFNCCYIGMIVGIILGVKGQRRARELGQDDRVPKVAWITTIVVGVLDLLGLLFLPPSFDPSSSP